MHRRLPWISHFVLALVATLAVGCGGDSPPHVVLITIDTLRADYVGCYGRVGASTPHIDRLAAEGVRFDQCQSSIPITLPSHASMFTGRVPPLHGIRNNGTYRLPDSVPTLAEELKDLGYQTGAFIAALPLSARFGLDRGFDRYDEELPGQSKDMFHFRERAAPDVVRAALGWVDEVGSKDPVFVWAHFFEPHSPYRPPPPYDARFAGRPYDGEVAAADASVGRLLEGLAQRGIGDPLVIVTSDHGEGLGEHGERSHAMFLYQTTLRVPMVAHWPGKLEAGKVVEEPVGLVDIAPTVLEWVGGDPARLRSEAFLSSPRMAWGIALPQDLDVPSRTLYSETLYPLETYRWSPAFVLRHGPLKVIRSARSWGFDLARDPGELNDLLSQGDGAAKPSGQLLSRADSVVSALAAFAAQLDAGRQMTPEETAALAALGYAGGVPAATVVRDDDALLRATRELSDPTDQIDVLGQIADVEEKMILGKDAEAVADLEELLHTNPSNTWLMALLAQGLAKVGRVEDAIAQYRVADAERPNWLEIQIHLARLCRRTGRRNDARRYYQRMVELDPANPVVRMEVADAFYQMEFLSQARDVLQEGLRGSQVEDRDRMQLHAALARVMLYLGMAQEGRRHLDQALAIGAPPRVKMIEADYLADQRKWGEAAEAYRLLLSDLPDSGELRLQLAVAEHQLGNIAEAQQLCAEAVEHNDELHLAHNNLAWYLAHGSDPQGVALRHARRAVELAPNRVEYVDTLIEVLVRQGQEEAARGALRQALARFPQEDSLRKRARDLGVAAP